MDFIKEIIERNTDENGVIDWETANKEINATVPKHFVPKKKYNDVVKEKEAAELKVRGYEDAQLTDDEKRQQAIDEANAEKDKYLKANAKLKAESILVKAGLTAEDYNEFIDDIVSTDEAATEKLANSLVKTLSTKIQAATDKAKEDGLKGTPKPGAGSGTNPNNETEAEKLANQLAKNVSDSTSNGAKGLEAYY